MKGDGQYIIHIPEEDNSKIDPTYLNCYVQVGVVNTGNCTVRGCKAELVQIARKEGDVFMSMFEQPLMLCWAFQDYVTIDVLSGSRQFVSLTSVEPHKCYLWPQTVAKPLFYKTRLNKSGVYRFRISARGENCLPIHAEIFLDIIVRHNETAEERMELKSAWISNVSDYQSM